MPAVNRYYSSVAVDTKLSSAITDSALTLTVASTTGFPTSYPYTLAIGYDLSNEELVTIISASGTTLTVGTTVAGGANIAGRGVDGTNDQAHAAGEPVKHVVSARDMTESQAHIAAEAGAHGVTGSFVGTSDTQTLTNKTITGGTVNPTTLQQNGVPAVTTTDAQELTNKTLGNTNNIKAGSTLTNNGTISGGTISGPTISNLTVTGTLALPTGAITSTMILDDTIVNADINASAAIADTKLATISTAGKVSNSATTATSANTASAIVARDASGNFTAGTVTANLTGNVTGNVSGSSGSTTGNAATATTTTGNAATATALQTARTINGVSFNGTANIRTSIGGQDTTTSGANKTITHGLGTTPSSVVVCARSDSYNTNPKVLTVGNIGATTFTVFANDTAGGAVATPFAWIATA